MIEYLFLLYTVSGFSNVGYHSSNCSAICCQTEELSALVIPVHSLMLSSHDVRLLPTALRLCVLPYSICEVCEVTAIRQDEIWNFSAFYCLKGVFVEPLTCYNLIVWLPSYPLKSSTSPINPNFKGCAFAWSGFNFVLQCRLNLALKM